MKFWEKKVNKKNNDKVFKGIAIAYGILLTHFILLAALGILVLFFRGVINYMTWIFLGGAAIILGSAYYFIRKIKSEKDTIREILLLPEFANKNIEIKLLGGAASLKLNKEENSESKKNLALPSSQSANSIIHDLSELSSLYEKNMISIDEYEELKKELLNKSHENDDGIIEISKPIRAKLPDPDEVPYPDQGQTTKTGDKKNG